MNNFGKILTGVAVSALFSVQALAANDGSLGTTSTGKSDVSIKVLDLVKISKVDNIDFADYDGTNGDMSASTSYCVFRNGGGTYSLTPTVDGETSFVVSDGTNTNTIPFSVRVDDDTNAGDGTAIVNHGDAVTGLTPSNSASCNSGENGAMEVTFAEADLQAADADTYSATVTLLVAPE